MGDDPLAVIARFFLAVLALLVLTGPVRADNPFGVMLWPQQGETLDMTLARARGLGIAWYRPGAIILDHWQSSGTCPLCAYYQHADLRLALVVRNSGQDQPSHRPSTPPTDLAAYKKSLGEVLDSWKPMLLVVETEENDPASLSGTGGDFASYGRELEAACAVAHAHKGYCTNGGLTSRSIASAVWLDFLQRGQGEQACDFAKRVFYTEDNAEAGAALCAYKTIEAVPPQVKAQALTGADRLLALYRTAAIDVVNFHWFIHDARALSQTVDYVSKITGKPAVSSEMGQWRWDASPAHVRPLLRAAFAAQMQLVIWYSIEGPSTASLFESDGRLRPAGWEFQRQMRGK